MPTSGDYPQIFFHKVNYYSSAFLLEQRELLDPHTKLNLSVIQFHKTLYYTHLFLFCFFFFLFLIYLFTKQIHVKSLFCSRYNTEQMKQKFQAA